MQNVQIPPQLSENLIPQPIEITGNVVTVAAASCRVTGDARNNGHIINRIIEDNTDVDWLAFPECAVSGYGRPPLLNTIDHGNTKQTIDAMQSIERKQREVNTGLIVGTSWVDKDGMPYNQARVYDKFGFRGAYNKQLLTTTFKGGGEANAWSRGWENFTFFIDDMKTRRAGVLICNDFFAHPYFTPKGDPYLIWQLAREGAGLLFVINNSITKPNDASENWNTLSQRWSESKLETMAKTCSMWIVCVNAAPTEKDHSNTNIPTCIINPRGEVVSKLEPNTQGVIKHTIQL